MDSNPLLQMIDNLARQHGLIPPVQPTYQIHPHPSHVHYSSTFDKWSPPHYPSTTYTSIHIPHNSSNTNDLAKEIEELKNIILSIESPQEKATFFAMCPSFSRPNVPSNPNPPWNFPYFEPNVNNHHPKPLPLVPPPHNCNPPKTSSPPRSRFFSPEFLAKCKEQDERSQSPKVILPIPSQDLPPKHDVTYSILL